MISVKVPPLEMYNNETEEFVYFEGGTINLEYSLHALSLWESKYHKPYLSREEKTEDETYYFVECMCVDEESKQYIHRLDGDGFKQIASYIEDPYTATTFRKTNTPPSREIITAEILYYNMIACNIPLEFEHRNLNQLMVLIKVCAEKNNPNPKKVNQKEQISNWAELNKKRREAMKNGTV